jgi:hypothetical protein
VLLVTGIAFQASCSSTDITIHTVLAFAFRTRLVHTVGAFEWCATFSANSSWVVSNHAFSSLRTVRLATSIKEILFVLALGAKLSSELAFLKFATLAAAEFAFAGSILHLDSINIDKSFDAFPS